MKRKVLLLAFACLLFPALNGAAADWESCSEALKALGSATQVANFQTLVTARKEKQIKESRRLADAFDVYREHRRTIRDEYQRQADEMEAAYVNLRSAMFEAELSCYYSLPTPDSHMKSIKHRGFLQHMCLKLKRHAQTMTVAQQLDFCKRIRFPGDCGKCLAPDISSGD